METKAERFRRLAESRVTAILQKLDVLSNLSNKSQYEWTDGDIEDAFEAIRAKMQAVKSTFVVKGFKNEKTKEGFAFGG
jgi:hypothetical protein